MLTKILNHHGPAFAGGRRVLPIFLSFTALFLFIIPLQAQQDSVTRAVEKVKKNVAILTANFSDGHQENGFGFVTGEKDGKLYIVTAGHVVHVVGGAKATSIEVELSNTVGPFPAKEVRWFERDDLSLLILDSIPGYRWEKNCLGKDPKVYDKVRFIGKGKERVSPDEGEIFSLEDPDRIGFTIRTVTPGTSGAPLVGKNGIIGMVTEDAEGTSYAVPISRIRALLGGANSPYLSALDSQGDTVPVNPSLNTAQPVPSAADISLRQYNMVAVPGGTFTMGCTSEQGSDCDDDEKPVRRVTVSDFYIGKYEVTQKEWREVMGSNPSYSQNCDNCPVEQVSWQDIQQFLARLNAKTGKAYRLPTEAEWEYAARGGSSQRYKYAGSNSLDEVGWYDGNAWGKLYPVGQKKANELGLHDMSGNVWEWCADWYGTYPSTAQINPKGPSGASNRVIRGGFFGKPAEDCRVSYRSRNSPTNRVNNLGFRLAL